MEMSCDEAVLKRLGEEVRCDYSASLLSLATGRRIIASMPLAFGEGDPKGRIQNMMRWKKTKRKILLGAAVLCAVAILACACNPQYAPAKKGQYKSMDDFVKQTLENVRGTTVSYYVSFDDDTKEASAEVLDAKVAYLDKGAELSDLAPEGVLECWQFNFYGLHYTVQQALYDWYVTEKKLDLPLYVDDWIDQLAIPEPES